MNKLHSIIVNAVIEKEGKILISQRSLKETHEPGKWTIPGGKIDLTKGNVWNIVEKTCAREINEETGISIKNEMQLITNNTFIRSTSQHVIALVFLCHWQSGEAKPFEDTIDTKWTTETELDNYEFAPNVRTYIQKSFETLKKQR